ncbi:serine/threonine-protein kinase MPS1 isoform X1 [Daucus carota subsp. sativus]|uniref:serine/threonine-protein kinase MPS1 isoform X1 n=1 Tax=Daucus carota subsp. sativus TaxID=79200 RepID=UPI0007EFCEE7|nr:PREDICTED: probable serine/threonine-protein kinase mps1 isoform X1 [Daucus carota subsp. sativus]
MDEKPILGAESREENLNFIRPINIPSDTNINNHSRSFTCTSTSSSSSSPPDFLGKVQAAFKRRRPLGNMRSNNIRPTRVLLPQRGTSKNSDVNVTSEADTDKTQGNDSYLSQGVKDYISQTKKIGSITSEVQEDASITPPPDLGTIMSTQEENHVSFGIQDQPRSAADCMNNNSASLSLYRSEQVHQKKVSFASGDTARAHEMDWDVSNQMEAATAVSQDIKHISSRSDVQVAYMLAKGTMGSQDQVHPFRNFLQSDSNYNMTQSSVVGSSCPTTTLMNSASAPIHNSTTYCSYPHQINSSNLNVESLGELNMNVQPATERDKLPSSLGSLNHSSGLSADLDQLEVALKASPSFVDKDLDVKGYKCSKDQSLAIPKDSETTKDDLPPDNKVNKEKACVGDVTDVQCQAPLSKYQSSDVKFGSSKPEIQGKVAKSKAAATTRKKSYDPEQFFKVNGKLYQRLGKIGSGGSSEVYKVISSDCKIYALKRIKLKGRDYATAYGFCQEIGYLNKLKGKNHIIQLIDYEVTDKALLQEVTQGYMSNKDRKVSDDGYVFMVLEYGEIDLAHMLSQKWKELDDSSSTIDENWLRFYWQQILLAVNTIHEERIVHSDLKPANFLLVRGSLKLIDFGIAKAIMSDTTNIQRDSQVGTLSYMSPEAFMCNDTDADGNIIKCGRSSDIWSLGCILYQMVYGRTPFSEYKTFWAKYKVITDPNHEIMFEPVSNPWLLDLMKKCLCWNRHERWRIPDLLVHPFLVPPITPPLSICQDQSCKFLKLVAESCTSDQKALSLCSQMQELLLDPKPENGCQLLLHQMSSLCFQLQKNIANSEGD